MKLISAYCCQICCFSYKCLKLQFIKRLHMNWNHLILNHRF